MPRVVALYAIRILQGADSLELDGDRVDLRKRDSGLSLSVATALVQCPSFRLGRY